MSGFEATDEQDGVGFNPFSLIEPDEIPYPTTDVGALNEAAAAIRSGGQELASISEDMESTWQGLQEHYTAPESETLFAAVGPVVTLGEGLESDLSTVATALEDLAEAASEAQRKLGDLRTEAESFAGGLEDRKFWWLTKDEENDDLAITTNLALKMRVNKAWADFTSAEVDCANTIANTCDGTTFATPGDSTEADMVYGANAEIFAEGTSFAEIDAAALAMMNELTGWAGEKFDSVEFENSMGQAAWDTLMVGVVFGTVQGAVTKSGYWHPERGWASPWDIPTRFENMKDTWAEAGMDAAALVGIHKEGDGWLLQPSSDDPFANLSWGWWWGNVETSAAQVRENHTAWSQRESDPLYSGTYSAINTAMLFTGPFKLGAEILKFGGGEFSGAEGGSGAGGESGSGAGSRGGAEVGTWAEGPGRGVGDALAEAGVPINERFDGVVQQVPPIPPVTPGAQGGQPPAGSGTGQGQGEQGHSERGPSEQRPPQRPQQGATEEQPPRAPRQDPSPGVPRQDTDPSPTPPRGGTGRENGQEGGAPAPREREDTSRGGEPEGRPRAEGQRDREDAPPLPVAGRDGDAPEDGGRPAPQDRDTRGDAEEPGRPRNEEGAPRTPPIAPSEEAGPPAPSTEGGSGGDEPPRERPFTGGGDDDSADDAGRGDAGEDSQRPGQQDGVAPSDTERSPDPEVPEAPKGEPTPIPADRTRGHILEQIDESRVTRNESGLIDSIDGSPVTEFLEDLVTERAREMKDMADPKGVSKKELGGKNGAVNSVVLDRDTGVIVEAVNGRGKGAGIIPEELHPVLEGRLRELEDDGPYPVYDYITGRVLREDAEYPHPDDPLRHAEVKAINELLWLRGRDVTEAVMGDFQMDNRYTLSTPEPRPAPCCPNCTAMTEGAPNFGSFKHTHPKWHPDSNQVTGEY
ncbi:hypothetical protein ACFV4I_14015 [Nocardiopsis alba]|uniref:hypothetical protein n=1 Tax=Nocardiopsis alba TaxID=53437 RepID=UPI003646AD9E